MPLISQTEDTEHSRWICHGIVIVLYNVSATSSTVIRDEWLLSGDHSFPPAQLSHAYHRNTVVLRRRKYVSDLALEESEQIGWNL